mmetsp:Transcript_315/g.874  ORF Transcript_315/g.874 Transcript_315/m.874 type:complete len:166 (+) Transcript_315:192-689(+)
MVAAGVPAIMILIGSIGGGYWAGEKYLAREEMDDGRPEKMTRIGVMGMVVAGVFWLWALLRTMILGFDLGCVSFLLAILASAYGAGLVPVPLSAANYKLACSAGYGAVVANYCLGFVLVGEAMLRAYFALAMAFWVGMLYQAFSILQEGGLDAGETTSSTTYSPI